MAITTRVKNVVPSWKSSRLSNDDHEEINETELNSLPSDILLNIISYLDLYSISRLSQSSRLLLNLTRSDLIWRQICRSLIGPWIHQLHHSTRTTDHDIKPPEKLNPLPLPDWTLDPNCFPVSQFTRLPSLLNPRRPTDEDHEPYTSWYQFATQFLIPHFNYLGWHVSETLGQGQLILVTFDTFSGRLIVEEIECQNFNGHDSQSSFSIDPGLPAWLPLNHPVIRTGINREQYDFAPDANLSLAGYSFDIFEPCYVSSPLFSISPFEPHFRLPTELSKTYEHMLVVQPKLLVKSWDHFIDNHQSIQTPYPISVIPRRSDIRFRQILIEDTLDFVNNPGVQSHEFHSFTLASSADNPTHKVGLPIDNDARIHYQGGPRYQELPMATILVGGRSFSLNAAGMLSQVVKTPIQSIEFYSINGPARFGDHPPQTMSGLDGIWVGCYGLHGPEFGKIVVESLPDSSKQMVFVKLTGDPNVPAGQISWKAPIDDHSLSLQALSLTEAISSDFTATPDIDENWLPGQGQVANTNFIESRWINIQVQLIKRTDQRQNSAIEIEQIRVKWIQLSRVASFFKVQF